MVSLLQNPLTRTQNPTVYMRGPEPAAVKPFTNAQSEAFVARLDTPVVKFSTLALSTARVSGAGFRV